VAPRADNAEYDVIVLGSGAAGMTAAFVAAREGARVLLIESTARVGGTSARSSGTLWIPKDKDAATRYLDALVGDKADRSLRQTFLDAGPRMVAYLERHAGFVFRPYPHHPDYRQDVPGAALGERPLEPPPFDGRALGDAFQTLGWPIPELMLFGGMMVTRAEAARLLESWKSPAAAVLGMRLVGRYALDRMRYRRGTRLVLGNALVARLFQNLLALRVPIWTSCAAERLVVEGGRLSGVRLSSVALRARKAVILAGGGFPASAALREQYLPKPVARHTPAYEGCVGETIRLGREAGGALGRSGEDNALWFPGSIGQRANGSTAVYPHIVLDRAKPGLIAVGRDGRRFTNEAASYHEFTRAMYRTGNVPAWLICDRAFLWKYGLGMIRPMTLRLKRYLSNGYLVQADSLARLAARIGVPPAALEGAVERFNGLARAGTDADFGKGGNPYDRANGDPAHAPNPCLSEIARAPFHAVRVEPVPLGTSLGLQTDEHASVLNARGEPIAGLYAVGNDMHSVMGGEYPGAGAQLGPAMTFGYLAALHAIQHSTARAASVAPAHA
jgi:succinate dehydrogenase/fumarate reductase flavoprotein subunit